MTVSEVARAQDREHASATRRLALAQDEATRLAGALASAAGTRLEPRAEARLSAGHAAVAAREQWLHWVDAGESLAPWADGEWAPEGTAGTTGGGRGDLALVRARIWQGEAALSRAVASVWATRTEKGQ